MLYHIFEFLEKNFDLPGTGLFRFLTFRAGLAIILSLIISMIFGSRIIKYLKRKQIGESVRDLGLDGQKEKEGTPTMGGIIIVLGIVVPTLLLADLTNIYVQLMLLVTFWMAIIGFTDDYIKVFKKDKKGLSGKFKVIGQVGLGLIVGVTMLMSDDVVVRVSLENAQEKGYEIIKVVERPNLSNTELKQMAYVKTTLTNVPFLKGNNLDYRALVAFAGDNASRLADILFVFLVIFIVTAVSNAANLTDGLDGLAAGVSAIIGAILGVFAYVSGHNIFADYLNILYLPFSGELVVYSAAFIGACIGFLWYNAYPARIFMGDTGSLTIGGIIAALAIVLRKELLIPILCGIFLIENLSVMIQVAWFKYTKKRYGQGRRVFLMAPLHHHYQKMGMHESQIVTRFWIVGVLLAVISVITLKIR
ncbi:MAG: phospho-N-acetylmuramoyl-pentapeptide-transferase [Saprospirales bacterium]|nr:MAG: phospho-N-acetylmuramoyl-pentapeptide-transferase [Saprospirales bacterium]